MIRNHTSEEKQASCKYNSSNHHRRESSFGDCSIAILGEATEVILVVADIDDCSSENTGEHGEERQTPDHWAPAPASLKDDGETAEVGVQEAWTHSTLAGGHFGQCIHPNRPTIDERGID